MNPYTTEGYHAPCSWGEQGELLLKGVITDHEDNSYWPDNGITILPYNGQQQGVASCIKTRWVVCNCIYIPGCNCNQEVCKCRHCVAMRTSIMGD